VPPTGVEVVPDDRGMVRDAVTLQRLEYCVLVGEDGRKKFVRGEAVVFPDPSQHFLQKNGVEKAGRRAFKAIELSEITGLYVKVIAPYTDDDGVAHTEGEELFLTGRSKIYFPREEHAVIRYGDGEEVHQAVAIPAGEGRYVLDRLSGEVALVVGPRMFLPDPRREVITRRVLSDREVRLFYPGNEEALVVNQGLRRGGAPAAKTPARVAAVPKAPYEDGVDDVVDRLEGDAFSRNRIAQPRTLTLDTKYDGAISLRVWSGHAVQVVDRSGARRVVRGPATVLLRYDETLEALSLSTGVPKKAERPLQTVYLQVTGNQVSDEVAVVTSDLVEAKVRVKYRVSFEGDDAERWFSVADYVKLLCDHASSIVKAAARKVGVRALKERVADVVRDAVLGERPASGQRAGLAFAENAMRIYDVEVLDLAVLDGRVSELLAEAQLGAIQSAVEVASKQAALTDQQCVEQIERSLLQEHHKTKLLEDALVAERDLRAHALEEERQQRIAALRRASRAAELDDAAAEADVKRARLAGAALEQEAQLQHRAATQTLDVALLGAKIDGAVRQAQAYSPDLVAALQRLTDAQLLSSLAANFGELAAVEGKGLLETARKFLDFVPHSSLPALRPRTKTDGDAGPGAPR
jgi:major vault protein